MKGLLKCIWEISSLQRSHLYHSKTSAKSCFLQEKNQPLFLSKQQKRDFHVETLEIELQVWQALVPVLWYSIISNNKHHSSVVRSHTLLLNNKRTPHHFTSYIFYGKISNYSRQAWGWKATSGHYHRQRLHKKSPLSPSPRCDHQLRVVTHSQGFLNTYLLLSVSHEAHAGFINRW